jgi:hypothetical protein
MADHHKECEDCGGCVPGQVRVPIYPVDAEPRAMTITVTMGPEGEQIGACVEWQEMMSLAEMLAAGAGLAAHLSRIFARMRDTVGEGCSGGKWASDNARVLLEASAAMGGMVGFSLDGAEDGASVN